MCLCERQRPWNEACRPKHDRHHECNVGAHLVRAACRQCLAEAGQVVTKLGRYHPVWFLHTTVFDENMGGGGVVKTRLQRRATKQHSAITNRVLHGKAQGAAQEVN